ncbi:TetR/AcrR family transcriptional regulator [Gemmatimonas sp.]|jgi:AcrR family transcriptional regulator|uniref:TetR/AcrR family transcriptional regulator n=1 Tax=Gemmatimonas sp. TaxID=1962908 RepID=UPI0031BE75AE|nr:helix-turn-helix transcriptional regulator [Gemmatimonas sp.]
MPSRSSARPTSRAPARTKPPVITTSTDATSASATRRRAAVAALLAEHAFALLRESPDAPFNHEAVAAAAGVSPRTAYRYFPTQGDLVAAVWRQLRDRTGTVWPETEATIIPYLRDLFAQFERNNALTRAVIAAAPRANISQHGSAEGRAAFKRALAPRLAIMSRTQGAQLVATCVAIYSAPFWQMLRDRGQLSPAGAADAACHAMQALLSTAPTPP